MLLLGKGRVQERRGVPLQVRDRIRSKVCLPVKAVKKKNKKKKNERRDSPLHQKWQRSPSFSRHERENAALRFYLKRGEQFELFKCGVLEQRKEKKERK